MIFSFHNLISILIMLALLAISSFWLYLPISLFFKNKNKALSIAIPISLASEVILGYIFYSLRIVGFFPYFFAISLIIVNAICLPRYLKANKAEKIRGVYKIIIGATILAIPIIFTRYYDPITNLAPGGFDTWAHVNFVKDLSSLGYLSQLFYAPGFHLIMYPIEKIIGNQDLYRFGGPTLGLIFVMSFWFALREIIKEKSLLIIGLLISACPVYNQLTLQTIYFFPSLLSFIFLLGFINLLIDQFSKKEFIIFGSIIMLGLALAVPYLIVQLIMFAIALCILACLLNKFKPSKLNAEFSFKQKVFLVMVFLGLVVAFGHVFFQTKIQAFKDDQNGFPTINTIVVADGDLSVTGNYESISPRLRDLLSKNNFSRKYILPMVSTGADLVHLKNIRPLNSVLSIGAYLWVLVGLVFVFIGFKKNKPRFLIFGTMILVFALATQSGLLEMSYYRGRAGWYLLLLSIIGSLLILENKYYLDLIKRYPRVLWAAYAVLYIVCFISPPVFYRAYFKQVFPALNKIVLSAKSPVSVYFLSAQYLKTGLLSDKIDTIRLDSTEPEQVEFKDNSCLIMERDTYKSDPVLSQSGLSQDKNFKIFYKAQANSKIINQSFNEKVLKVKSASGLIPKFEDKDSRILCNF